MEVRHVDTGQLVQVIPGNNLRCLFADTPPSTTNSAANYYNRGYRGWQPPYPGMAPNGYPYAIPPHGRPGGSYVRDEIIIVSEDRVMAVKLAPGLSDGASMHSSMTG